MGSQNSGTAPFRLKTIQQAASPNGAGNGAALPSVQAHTIILKAVCPGQTIYLGIITQLGAAANLSVANGFPMNNGDTLTLEIANANLLCQLATAAGCYLGIAAGVFN